MCRQILIPVKIHHNIGTGILEVWKLRISIADWSPKSLASYVYVFHALSEFKSPYNGSVLHSAIGTR